MSDAMAAGGSPVEMTFQGRVYKFSPHTFGDICDFEAWVKTNLLRESLAALGETTTPAERIKMIAEIMALDVARIAAAEMKSFSGQRYMVYQSLKHCHPDITIEDVTDLLSVESIDALTAIVESITLPDAMEGDQSRPPAPKGAAPGSPSPSTSRKPTGSPRKRSGS